ncbi:hypothetical protein [Pseudoalteromonas sp. G4]|uniref:hypothetical protein n=1 Tax=Pseudoalteromonas sp. G4 TaxID=2992761 RepID=UPI00237E902E|nr:hypothetical protein [Pseudoalteromonas sp. G4]MDE3270875.1 hypothetical protein [Pseudoalteromonas sp. G4]
MKSLKILIFASIFFISPAFANQLKPFTSDGCSAFPDGTFEQNTLWLNCCVAHDLAYWQGGTYQQRKDADIELKECVAAVGEKQIANLMLAGVRVGGSPFFPTTFRWGYGWPYPKLYGELSKEEMAQVTAHLDENPTLKSLISTSENSENKKKNRMF